MKPFTLAMTGSVVASVALAARFGEPPASQPITLDPLPYSAVPGAPAHPVPPSSEALNGGVRQYCVICHNDALIPGGVSFAAIDVARAEEKAETVERMIRKLRAGMMPPPGMPRPGGDTLKLLVEALENRIDQVAAKRPQPSSRVFQRLNRAEYANSVREVLALEVDVDSFLPAETMSSNFDNIAEMQLPSATLLEGYLRAADWVSRVAVGDPDAGPGSTTYKVPRTASQLERAEGASRTNGGSEPWTKPRWPRVQIESPTDRAPTESAASVSWPWSRTVSKADSPAEPLTRQPVPRMSRWLQTPR